MFNPRREAPLSIKATRQTAGPAAGAARSLRHLGRVLALFTLVFFYAQGAAQSNATIGVEVSHGWTAAPGNVAGLEGAVKDVAGQEEWVSNVKTYLHNCSIAGSDCDTRYTGIDAQARAMSTALAAEASSGKLTNIDAFVLVGHSQGTLRNRAAVQFGYLDTALASKTIGLINVGSPGAGAPIVPNGTRFLARIKFNLDLATYGVWRAFAGLGVLLSPGFRDALFAAEGMTPSKIDMAPASSFTNRLNQETVQQCRFVRRAVWVGRLWWRHKEYRWVRVCRRVPANNRIPGHVAVLDIAGTNNRFSSLMPNAYNTIHGLGIPLSVAAVGFWSISWQIWPIPIATGLTNLSYIMLNFDNVWQSDVVGSREGDATVTLNTQLALKSRRYLLESPNLYTYKKAPTTHGAEPSNAEVLEAIGKFFDEQNRRGAYEAYYKLTHP